MYYYLLHDLDSFYKKVKLVNIISKKTILYFFLLFIILMVVVFISLATGALDLSGVDVLSILFGGGDNFSDIEIKIVLNYRLPRTLLAVFIGFGLAISGTSAQGFFRNPLADPGIIGIASGAALGAALAINAGLHISSSWYIILFAYLGAVITCIILFLLTIKTLKFGTQTLILAGIAISTFANGILALLIYLSEGIGASRSILFWLAGGFTSATWEYLIIVIPILTVFGLLVQINGKRLNLLQLGIEEAFALGLKVRRFQIEMIMYISVLVATSVSFTGIIPFVGLIAPHITRIFFGYNYQRLILTSGLVGAIMVLLADVLARVVIDIGELRPGLTLSIVGVPFFLFLIVVNQKKLAIRGD